MPTMTEGPADRQGGRALPGDARALAEALAHLLPLVQFQERDRLSAHGLGGGQWLVLRQVSTAAGGLGVNQLAASLYLDKSTASRIAAGLVAREYLVREPSAEDARVVRLTVTPAGRALVATILADEERDYALLLEHVPPARRAEIHLVVHELRDLLAAEVEAVRGSSGVAR